MAKKNITYDLFARITAPENVCPEQIVNALHNACITRGWDFAGNIEDELDSSIPTFDDLEVEVDE